MWQTIVLKENQDAYPSDIHKVLTLMNEYKPLKLDNPMVALPLQQKAPIKEARKEGPNPRSITVMLNGKR
jgi:hypothetical protein